MSIYASTQLFPRNVAINASVANNFTWVVQGDICTQYRIRIYDISDNSLDYDSGVVTLSTPLDNGQTGTHLLPLSSLVNGKQYVWDILAYQTPSISTISSQETFKTNSAPVITFTVPTTITGQSYTFTATYSQAESVSIQYYYFKFYDNTGNVILQTDNSYTGLISYKFDGFDTTNYSVQLEGYTQNNVFFQTGRYNFTVSYAKPNVNITPIITTDCLTSITTVKIGQVIVQTGYVNGTTSFVHTGNNVELRLSNSSSELYYLKDVPNDFTLMVRITPETFTSGKIIKLTGSTLTYEFGYDGSAFYINIGGTYMLKTDPVVLPSMPFMAILTPTFAYVKTDNSTVYKTKNS